MDKALSVIIPVFNGERFIAECLISIISQLRPGIEVIVINDGSSDATEGIILEGFGDQIAQGSLIYRATTNAGVSAARNVGLDLARGEYLAFVDADDKVRSNYVATVLAAIVGSPDIIEFGYRNINESGIVVGGDCYVHRKFGQHAAHSILDTVFSACLWYPFLRVFKRSLFARLRFPAGVRFCEDLMTLTRAYRQAGTILSLPDTLYEYRINSAGATTNIRPDYVEHLIAYFRQVAHDQSYPGKALRINLAYAIRRCTAGACVDRLGRMPADIEANVRRLIFSPRLLISMRPRLLAYALWGPYILWAKEAIGAMRT
jgi:glycosyltransferase involved in cell wall biosynthesis